MAEDSKEGAKAFVESTPRGYIVLAKEWDADAPTHFVEIANFGHRLGEALDFRDSIRHVETGGAETAQAGEEPARLHKPEIPIHGGGRGETAHDGKPAGDIRERRGG